MGKSVFEQLEVYQLSEKLSQAIWRIVRQWPAFDRNTLGKQLVRAADSIGANIAEGFGRGNGPDHKRFIRIARGSMCEVKHWLRLAFGRELLQQRDVDLLKPLVDELPPRLNVYLKAIGRQRSTINTQQSTIG
jgi:four helix bundle protein